MQFKIGTSENLELHVINIEQQTNITKESWLSTIQEKGLFKETLFRVVWKENEQKQKKELIGTFVLSPMPGCCGIVVSNHLFVEKEYRGTNISKEFMKLKESTAQMLGYPAVIATTQTRNIAEIKSAKKRGYKIIKTWKNTRTGNELALLFKITDINLKTKTIWQHIANIIQ